MKDRASTISDFKQYVNLSKEELSEWLDTDESQSVGIKNDDSGEAVGHQR